VSGLGLAKRTAPAFKGGRRRHAREGLDDHPTHQAGLAIFQIRWLCLSRPDLPPYMRSRADPLPPTGARRSAILAGGPNPGSDRAVSAGLRYRIPALLFWLGRRVFDNARVKEPAATTLSGLKVVTPTPVQNLLSR
jgi:hypothetical protein